jgi:exoribonuclease II
MRTWAADSHAIVHQIQGLKRTQQQQLQQSQKRRANVVTDRPTFKFDMESNSPAERADIWRLT